MNKPKLKKVVNKIFTDAELICLESSKKKVKETYIQTMKLFMIASFFDIDWYRQRNIGLIGGQEIFYECLIKRLEVDLRVNYDVSICDAQQELNDLLSEIFDELWKETK